MTYAALQEFVARTDYYQGSIRELAGLLPADDTALDTLIAQAVAASADQEFIYVVMAALTAGRPVAARHLARGTILIPDKWTLGIIATHSQGDIASPLVEAVRELRLPSTELVSSALFLAAEWCREHQGGKIPGALIGAARTAARNPGNGVYDRGLLHAVAAMAGDAGLMQVVLESNRFQPGDPRLKGFAESATGLGREMLTLWRRPPLENLPASPRAERAMGTTMRRAVARVGRNEPCPCGSGKKYKHCCVEKDNERLHNSTRIAGVTEAELRANPERYLTSQELQSLPGHEAARFDPLKVAPELRNEFLACLCRAKLFDACTVALEKYGWSESSAEAWDAITIRAAQARRRDLVERLMKLRPPEKQERLRGSVTMLLADQKPEELVQLIQEAAMTGLANEDLHFLHKFTVSLFETRFCALGICLARGLIPILPKEEAARLLEATLQARDKLMLAPEEPISDVLDKRFLEERGGESKEAKALREAQQRLQLKIKELDQYRESAQRLERELERREKQAPSAPVPGPTPTAGPASPPPEAAALAELRQKFNALREDLKERHRERNELRRELQKAHEDLDELRQKPAAQPAPEEADTEEDWLLPQENSGNQPVRVIEFPKGFRESLESLPKSVARGTLTLLGRLAAGEPAAFVGAVRLKACPSILRARIGIDFRLLFRPLPDRIQVVDLIPRQDLERKIKTLV
jgi:hypothetical protein